MTEYNRLISMTTSEKYQDFANKVKDPFCEGFLYSVGRDIQKKDGGIKTHGKELTKKELTQSILDTKPNKKIVSLKEQRDLRKFFAYTDIEKHKEIYESDKFEHSHFGNINSFEEFTEYHLNRLKESVAEFTDIHQNGEIYDFFVRYFGMDFRKKYSSSTYREVMSDIDVEYHRRPNFGNIITHITGQKVWNTKPHPNTKVMIVSINPYWNSRGNYDHYLSVNEMASIVSQEFGSKPYLVERGFLSISPFRMFFLLDDYISDERKRGLEGYFYSKYGFTIHIIEKNEFSSLPFSGEMPLFGTLNGASPLGITFESHEETFQRISRSFSEKSIVTKTAFLKDILNKRRLTEGKLPEYVYSGAYMGSSHGYEKFTYGRGTRHTNQIKLAMRCVADGLGYADFERWAYALNDGSSYDMANLSAHRIQKILESYWRYATLNVVPSEYVRKEENTPEEADNQALRKRYDISDTVSFTYLDTSENARLFYELIEKFYDRNYSSDRQQGYWKNVFLKDSYNLYRFLIRKHEYTLKSGKRYIEEGYEELNKGISFPTAMFNDVKKYLKLQTNIPKLLKAFEAIGLVKKVKVNDYEYSYKNIVYSIHYVILIEKEFDILINTNNNINDSDINYVRGLQFIQIEGIEGNFIFVPKNQNILKYLPPPDDW